MNSLFAKADAIKPLKKRRKTDRDDNRQKPSGSKESLHDLTLTSVARNTGLPKSLRPTSPPPEGTHAYSHVKDKKLRTQLTRESAQAAWAKRLVKDAELLLSEEKGLMEVEGAMEKTWRVGQDDITTSAGQEAARGRKEWRLDGGPYRSRYTRNGRHLAIVGKSGHVATFDWQTGTMHAELQLKETCRDITFLHDHSHFAVAQKKYVYIYDRDGVELHCLKSHIEPTRLEFLPYHWLLVSVGNPGYLKYQDTSTGSLVVEHRTKLGACTTMTQNQHNAVIHLGHQNGTVTLWTPNLPHPAVRLLAHLGPVAGVSVDGSTGGRYMATSGKDGVVKIWDCRNWNGAVRTWNARGGSAELEWSQRGALAVGTGGSVNVYVKPAIQTPFAGTVLPPLYMTHPVPHRPLTSVRFCPFQDILTIGHNDGLSSILVPGAGEPNFDSSEADPFENKRARREREVKGLLDKIQPDMISLDPEFVGSLAPEPKLTTAINDTHDIPFARLPRMERLRVIGKADETEDADEQDVADDGIGGKSKPMTKAEKEKKKMRGKNKSLKRYLRKQRKNVVDPTAVAVRERLARQRDERERAKAVSKGEGAPKSAALDRFKKR
ncbi:BING4CT-domain-containing protein [Cristinia sonorae]|uniref:U three protein 7 n=1 Tax=Cristinia sonorae TaxID=1940300 RepID=A0A8K0XNJ0_9AGAR|nr:BING4CT-domain-containing protein [Cristinia sonorae]